MKKHTNGSASHPPEVPTCVWCAIDCCFSGESERSLEAVGEAIAPFVTYHECLAAFRECASRDPGLEKAFSTEAQQAVRGLLEVVQTCLFTLQVEGAVTFKLAPDLHRVAAVVLDRTKSPTLQQLSRWLWRPLRKAWRAVEDRLADGKEVWEPSLRQTLWAAVGAPCDASIRRWIVDTLLEQLYSSPQYRTVRKDGFPHVRLKRRTTRARRPVGVARPRNLAGHRRAGRRSGCPGRCSARRGVRARRVGPLRFPQATRPAS
jgi:hypothetical protein